MGLRMISACFTTYNRTELLFEAVEPFLKDERITEVVISDDHSTEDIYQTILWKYNGVDKVKIFRNEVNLDCNKNKRKAVELATGEYVFLLDSDNVFSKEFIDAALAINRLPEVILQPSFARPHFDFRKYQNELYFGGQLQMNDGTFQTMLNACNFFVNRERYLKYWDGSIDPVTSDSIYQNYKWFESGGQMFVVKGMEYDHRISGHGKEAGSHYQSNNKRTPVGFHNEIIRKLQELK